MICSNVLTFARGPSSIDWEYRSDGSLKVTLRIALNGEATSHDDITIIADRPSYLEPIFGYLPAQEEMNIRED